MVVSPTPSTNNDRHLLRQQITSLFNTEQMSLYARLLKIHSELKSLGPTELSEEEFVAIISLFNQKLPSYTTATIFKVLLMAEITPTQAGLLLDFSGSKRKVDGLYWNINWSFLDKSVQIKRYLVLFVKKLVKRSPYFSFEAARFLFLFISDEDVQIRVWAYIALCRIYRLLFQSWTPSQQEVFKKSARSLSSESLKILKSEYRRLRRGNTEVKIKAEKVGSLLRVIIKQGKLLRRTGVRIRLEEKETVEIASRRKYTTIYTKVPDKIVCSIFHNNTLLTSKTCLFDDIPKDQSNH
ncbi:hypothetical protein NEHOM01_2537 [Nematocida homosporus]|uniref:uncharacterized protein n=1 Tax=Nematocida homosporus TaxID=1912981 RepID=UPI002220D963|nr:uncharacterized protein NEHOM01_2537 [Nematocida homosporus]KAI5188147.1 hypothetical protein NEHOM01_2537 [Nematocida homosporus]